MWDPDYISAIGKRTRLTQMSLRDGHIAQAINNHYAKNPIDFIQECCVTVDPRLETLRTMPFILFDRQKDFVRYWQSLIADKENGLTEKCRDAGVTWLCCAMAVHDWRYTKDSSTGFGSSKEMKVDKIGDMDSIFEKIRTIIRFLPTHVLPEDFIPRRDLSYMKIINRCNGAIIKGEAGDNIGRGGRSRIYIKDESAHYERPEKIEAALSMNTNVQLDVSSVNGAGNVFHRRRNAGLEWTSGAQLEKGRTRIFIFDWRDDPRKTQEWYDLKRRSYDLEGMSHIFAQEIDRDYFSAVEGVIIPNEWVKSAIDAHEKLQHLGDWSTGEDMAAQDVADGGRDRNAYAQRKGVILNDLDHWGGLAEDAAKRSIPKAVDQNVTSLFYDCIGVGVGFRSQAKNMRAMLPASLKIIPWDAAGAVLDPTKRVVPDDPKSPKNEDRFLNQKAQGWWRLRTRFYKTHMAITKGEKYEIGELISLWSKTPYIHQACTELSQPTCDYNGAGKMIIDKTPDGTVSPNLADAIMMCFNPVRPPMGVMQIL